MMCIRTNIKKVLDKYPLIGEEFVDELVFVTNCYVTDRLLEYFVNTDSIKIPEIDFSDIENITFK